jgi:DNA-binding IclR family transcriptional regulator
MPLLASQGALAIAAVVAIAFNAREGPIRSKTLARRLALPERHLEPMLQAMARHGIVKGTRGPLGGVALTQIERLLRDQYNALATPVPPHLAELVEKLKNADMCETSGYSESLSAQR